MTLRSGWTTGRGFAEVVAKVVASQAGVALTLGIDIAVRAAHQATLARDGKTVWRGRKFAKRSNIPAR